MEKKNYYGVLMDTKIISEFLAIYIPTYLVEGQLENYDDKCIFVDKMDNGYVLTTDSESMYSEIEKSVAFIISEEDLLNRYSNMSIEQSKKEYFNETLDYILLGRMEIDESENIELLAIDVNELSCVTTKEISKSSNSSKIISINEDEMKKILNIEDLNKIKETLSKLYEKNKNTESIVQNSNKNFEIRETDLYEINDELIIRLIYDNVQALLLQKDLEGRQIILSTIIYNLSGIYDQLDSMEPTIEIEQALSFLESTINQMNSLFEIESIEKSNNIIKKYIVESKNNFLNILCIYNKNNKTKEELGKEIDMKIKSIISDIENEIIKERINVKQMKKYLDEVIIGQEEAKKDVIQAIFMNQLVEDHRDKNSVLLIGPTGSGKTLIAEAVSKYLDKPMIIIDTTQLTTPGYVGSSIEDFLLRIYNMTNGDLEKAQSAIVVLDEIDKKGDSSSDDIFGKGVLNTLLPFIEGTTYDLEINRYSTVQFDTSNLTIIATGAFANVASAMRNNGSDTFYKSNSIGFGSKLQNQEKEEDIKYDKIEIHDLVKYGKMPAEFMGRFTTITQLSGHTIESLKKILLESKLSALLAEKIKLAKVGIDVEWNEEYLDAVAKKALKLKTGARSLKSTVEYSIKEARWEVISNQDIWKKILLNKDCVEDNTKCIIETVNGEKFLLKDILVAKEKTSIVPVKIKKI